MADKLDVVMPTHPKDIVSVTAAIDAALANVLAVRYVFVVSSQEYRPRSPAERWIPEANISTLPTADAIRARWESEQPALAHRAGWVHQQLLKLGAAGYIEELLPDFVCVDSDTIFLRPVSFLREGTKFVYTTAHYPEHKPYLDSYRCLLGEEPGTTSFTAHHMHYNVDLVRSLFQQIEDRHGKAWSAAVLDCIDYAESSPVNEQDLYGTWVTSHYPSAAYHRPLAWADVPRVPGALRRQRLSKRLDFVSAHSYLRRRSPLSFDRARLRSRGATAIRQVPGGLSAARRANARLASRRWKRSGSPGAAPPALKQETVRRYGRLWRLQDFVETGTYQGDMIAAVHDQFRSVTSIEIDESLHQFAAARHAGRSNVTLLEGDSAELLSRVVSSLRAPALFWLDAHYSAGITGRGEVDTPVKQELRTILGSNEPDHVILIDDARAFDGSHAYPTIEEVEATVASLRPGWVCEVEDDIIRIHPPRAKQVT